MKDNKKRMILGTSLRNEPKHGSNNDSLEKINTFNEILNTAVSNMRNQSKRFVEMGASKFEEEVAKEMAKAAEGTVFEGGIQLIRGHSFPDIDAGHLFGVEVKSTVSNKWTSTGNSIFEGCRIRGIERIYIFFGKLDQDPDFRYRKIRGMHLQCCYNSQSQIHDRYGHKTREELF